MCCS
jgi:hypothetical protein